MTAEQLDSPATLGIRIKGGSMRLPLFVLTVLPALPLAALCLASPSMAQDVSSSADSTSSVVMMSPHKDTTRAGETADATSSATSVAGKTIDFMKDATSVAGQYSGDIEGTATATKLLGGFAFGLNSIGDVARIYSAGQKEGSSGAARETAQIATEEGAKTALTTGVALATGEAAGGPLSITACAAFEVGLWCRDHTALGKAVQNGEYHLYMHITGKDAPMPLSQTTGPTAYTKQKLLQALKDAGITSNSTPSSDSTIAARTGPNAGPRSNVDLMGPLKAAGIVGTAGPESGSVNLMGPLRAAGIVAPTAPETPRSQAAALAAGLTAWNRQQAELQREQEEAARQAAEERQEQEQERARIDAELAEDSDGNSDSGSADSSDTLSLQQQIMNRVAEDEAARMAPYRQAYIEQQQQAYAAAMEQKQAYAAAMQQQWGPEAVTASAMTPQVSDPVPLGDSSAQTSGGISDTSTDDSTVQWQDACGDENKVRSDFGKGVVDSCLYHSKLVVEKKEKK